MSNEISFPDFAPCQPSPSVADRLTLLTKLNEIKSQMQEVSPKPDKTPEITMAQLNYFRNPNNQEGRFRTFTIPKKTGGVRIITAPLSPEYRWLLRALNVWLQSMYTPSDYAMGFVKQRSVCSNAQAHAGKNYIFNLDLKDFFPSIRQARVCARLQCPPFSFTQEVASTVAGLVAMRLEEPLSLTETHVSYVLPQGSPVSPLLTNAICDALDRQLAGLAKRFGLTYTRYADDLTFSSMHNVYHEDGEFLAELRRIIAKEGFQINEKKTRLQKRGMRQEVTGVVVNEKTNVTRQYMREIRNLLYIWERYGYMAALYRWNEHYRKYGAAYKTKHVTMIRVIRGKLMYMRMVKGKTDTTYRTLYARFKTLLSTWYRNATYIHNVRRMAAHRLLDFEKYNGVDIQFAVPYADDPSRIAFPYAHFIKGAKRYYVHIKPYSQASSATDKEEWMVAECLNIRTNKLVLIIYHRDDTVCCWPRKNRKARIDYLDNLRQAHTIDDYLQEEVEAAQR